jgi:radical SAM protein with 4Fe4S-binding SPASM domain
MKLARQMGQALRALATRRLTVTSDGIPYEFRDLPRRKVWNAILTEASAYFKPLRPWGRPTHLMIEPSASCNLRCALCPIATGLGRPQGMMDLATFKEAVDQIAPTAFTLLLWDWGEPFLNPDIFAMIAHAKRAGLKVISSTNGHPFARDGHAEALVRSGLDTIIFAVDGATQETYARYRQGGQLVTALAGLGKVVAAKRALGSATPIVNLRFIVMAENEHEIPRMRALAPRLGVDVLTFKTLCETMRDPYVAAAPTDATAGATATSRVPRDPRYQRFRFDQHGRAIRRRRNPCKHLWTSPVVHWNGNVCPCTYDPGDRRVLGNLGRQPFADIWRGERYRRERRAFRADWRRLPVCSACSYAFAGGSLNCETMAETVFYASFRP